VAAGENEKSGTNGVIFRPEFELRMATSLDITGKFEGPSVATRRRQRLSNPLQRDLDRIRLAGLDRLAGLALEALPHLECVAAAADRATAGLLAADPDAVRAMAVRAVLLEALEELGPSPDAAAIRALYGAAGATGPGAAGATDLQLREAAAAALVGRSTDTYRRRVRGEVLPRVAEAVLRVERRRIDTPEHVAADGAPSLQVRRDHPRVERLLEQATESVFVSGINLDAVISCVKTVKAVARHGVHVRLLAGDPRGRLLQPFAQFSGVDSEVRRGKISHNLRHLATHVEPARGRIELHITDAYVTTGCIGIDLHLPSGLLIVQHYLRATGADESPTMRIERALHPKWYDVYERALEDAWRQSSVYARSGNRQEAKRGDRFARRAHP
jgi:hypothetical protein